jgi:hypothetical protein
VTVLYIGGAARSGSTLLDRILHTLPGYTSVGELISVFRRGVLRNERCSCGEWFSDCAFWSGVGAAAFGGWDPAFADLVLQRQNNARLRRRYGLGLLSPGASGHAVAGNEAFVEAYVQLYRTLAELTGARVLVDSSKAAILPVSLSTSRHLDMRLLQLVRAPHGTVYSWSKQQIERPNANEWQKVMPSYPTMRASRMWLHANLAATAARRRRVPGAVMLYDDLVASPRAILRSVLDELDLEADLSGIGADFSGIEASPGASTVTLQPGHFLGGNPWRSATPEVELRRDDEWTRAMARRDRVAVTALTAPLAWWLRSQAVRPAGDAEGVSVSLGAGGSAEWSGADLAICERGSS